MGNVYIDEGLRRAKQRVDERIRRERKATKQKQNVAAFVDFASNLFTSPGSSATGTLFPKSKVSSAAFNSFITFPKDYNGVVAGNMFRVRFPSAQRGTNSNNV